MNNISLSSKVDFKFIVIVFTLINAIFGVPSLIQTLSFYAGTISIFTIAATANLVAFIGIVVSLFLYLKGSKLLAMRVFIVACLIVSVSFHQGRFSSTSYPALIPLDFTLSAGGRRLGFGIHFIIPMLLVIRNRNRPVELKRVVIILAILAAIIVVLRYLPMWLFF